MKYIHRIVLLLIVLVSVGLMGWAVVAGWNAPETKKIANTMKLVCQYDDNWTAIEDELQQTLPVKSSQEGIEAMNVATINQMRGADGLNYDKTVSEIRTIDGTLLQNKQLYDDAIASQNAIDARKAELEELKATNRSAYNKTKAERDSLDKKYTANDEFIKSYEATDNAERYNVDNEWVERIAKVKGSDFDAESALVLEYMQFKHDNYVNELANLKAAVENRKANFDADLATFANICETFGVTIADKSKNPEDEQADRMPDYKATIALLNGEDGAFAKKEKEITDKKAWKNDFKPVKEKLTAELIASIEAYDDLTTSIVVVENGIATTADNIETVKKAVADAKADGESLMTLAEAVYWNICWLYCMMLFAIVFVVAGFILNLFQNPSWLKILLTLVVVGLVGGAAYFIAANHGWMDGTILYVLDANGAATDIAFGIGSVDSPDRYEFTANEYMLTDVTIWITYLAAGLGVVAAVYSSVIGIFKK